MNNEKKRIAFAHGFLEAAKTNENIELVPIMKSASLLKVPVLYKYRNSSSLIYPIDGNVVFN